MPHWDGAAQTNMYVQIYKCMCIYIYIFVCVSVCVCVRTYMRPHVFSFGSVGTYSSLNNKGKVIVGLHSLYAYMPHMISPTNCFSLSEQNHVTGLNILEPSTNCVWILSPLLELNAQSVESSPTFTHEVTQMQANDPYRPQYIQ